MRTKNTQKTQQNIDNTIVRRNEKTGSFLRTSLLIAKSAIKVKIKSEKPSAKLLGNPITGKKAKVERPTTAMQSTASAVRAFLADGRENIEE